MAKHPQHLWWSRGCLSHRQHRQTKGQVPRQWCCRGKRSCFREKLRLGNAKTTVCFIYGAITYQRNFEYNGTRPRGEKHCGVCLALSALPTLFYGIDLYSKLRVEMSQLITASLTPNSAGIRCPNNTSLCSNAHLFLAIAAQACQRNTDPSVPVCNSRRSIQAPSVLNRRARGSRCVLRQMAESEQAKLRLCGRDILGYTSADMARNSKINATQTSVLRKPIINWLRRRPFRPTAGQNGAPAVKASGLPRCAGRIPDSSHHR